MRHATTTRKARATVETTVQHVVYPWHLIKYLEQRRREQRERVADVGNDLNPRLVELFTHLKGQVKHSN